MRSAGPRSAIVLAGSAQRPDPPDLFGLINITETLHLDRSGNSMTGSVALDLFAPDTTTHLAHLADGSVIGSRVTP